MADKEYEINIKTTSELEGVTSVKDALSQTKTEAEETKQALEEAFNNATAEVERLEEALTEAEINGDDIGADILSDELAEAREKAEELESQLNNFDATSIDELNSSVSDFSSSTDSASTSTETLSTTITSIDPSVIEQLRDAMESYGNQAGDSANATENLLEGLASGGMAYGLGNTFMSLANKAGDYNDSMLRMGLALEGHAMTVDEVSQKYGASVTKMANETGRGGGSVRNHFSNMAIAGVTSQKTLEASFQAVATGSFYSGESIESLSNKFQRITMTGMLSAKQLSGLGLTMNDLAKTMGVSADEVSEKFKSMSEEERASVLATASANKYGSDVNEVFKHSWEGLWTQLDKGKAGLERLVGELLLPYLIPAVEQSVELVKQLTDQFKALPQPVKDVMGGVMIVGTAFSTLGLGLNAVLKTSSLIISPFRNVYDVFKKGEDGSSKFTRALESVRTKAHNVRTSITELAVNIRNGLSNAFKSVTTFVRSSLIPSLRNVATVIKTNVRGAFTSLGNIIRGTIIPTLRNAITSFINLGRSVMTAGLNALKTAGMWVIQKAQLIATYIANGLVTVSQWALNIAMSMNPIGIIIMAIVGLIAVLTYLYFNNEQVRGAIDGLGQSIMFVAQMIWNTLVTAFNMVITTLQGFWNFIVGLGANLLAQVGITNNGIIAGILGFLVFFATLPLRIAVTFANLIARALGFGNNFVQNIVNAGSRAVSGFVSSIGQMASGLANELNNMLSLVGEWASTLPQKFWDAGVNAVKNFLSALGIRSPGTMQRMMVWEVNEMGNRIPRESQGLMTNIRRMGEQVVDEFGKPVLSVGTAFDNASFKNSDSQSSTSQVFNFNFSDVVIDNEDRMQKIVEAVRKEINWNNKTAGRTI